jgi:hypothetical protein
VLEISDPTYVLGGGRLVMEGTPAELGSSPAFVESFLGGARTPRTGDYANAGMSVIARPMISVWTSSVPS